MRSQASKLACLPALAFLFSAIPAKAHDFGSGGSFYTDFLTGFETAMTELPVLLLLGATGILVSLWDKEGLPKVWLAFAIGVITGLILPLFVPVHPVYFGYGGAMAAGLVAAAAIKPDIQWMRVILFVAGLLPASAILADHEWGSVPTFVYVGIFFMLNLGLAVSAGIVSQGLERLAYGWTSIVFRALASWLVAIALMSLAFLLRTSA